MAYVNWRWYVSSQSAIMVLKTLFFSRSDGTTIMKLRIKIERQKIARGHGSNRSQIVQADQRTQRERDRGASKRAVLKRELDNQ
jgi:RNA polymerase-interacting CarD/CdnL/TRCF family regulator